MADFSSLKQTIQTYVKQNGNEEITGNILQDVLLAMVSTMGDSAINGLASALQNETAARQNQDGTLQGDIDAETTARQQADTALGGRIDGLQTAINGINTKLAEGYIYAGIVTPSTDPGNPSGKVFNIAIQAGTYTNFGGAVVAYGINILKYNGSAWSLEQIIAIDARPKKASQNLVASGGVFDNIGALDVSELNATENPHTLAQYSDLSAALAAIPTDYQKGGMSIKFVQSSDNKYVQYRLMANTFSTTVADWQGIDELGQKVDDLTDNIDIEPIELGIKEEIIVQTNDGEEIARFDKNGFLANKIKPSNGVIDYDSLNILDNSGKFVAKITADGIHAKDFIIQSSFEDSGYSVKEAGAVSINLPDMITAVVGDILQIFLRGVIMAFNPYIYDVKFTCQKGRQTPRYFQVSPTSEDVGEYPLQIDVRNHDGSVAKTKSTTLKIVDKINLVSSTKNVLCFGDSLTSGGVWCAEADRRLTGSGGTPSGLALPNINFVGKLTNGTTGYFGQGGWSWNDFVTKGRSAFRFQVSGVNNIVYGAVYSNNGHNYTIVENNTTEGVGNILCAVSSLSYTPTASGVLTKVSGDGDATINFSSASADSQNPLWDYDENKMTFIPYSNEYCGGQIDIVYTLLTWNGQYAWRSNFDDIIVNGAKKFADTLHAEFPNAKLKILGIQVPSQNGGCGANYGATGNYGDAYGLAVTALRLNDAYQAFANDANYSSFVEFVNVSSQFDTDYNMPYSDADVNTRNSNKKEMVGTNGVHPSTNGYMQIADVVYRNMIKTLNN